MRYDTQKNRICMSARELVSLSRRQSKTGQENKEDARLPVCLPHAQTEPLLWERSGMRYEITAAAHTMTEKEIVLHVEVPTPLPEEEAVRQARGEAYVCAFVMAQKHNALQTTLRIIYHFDNKTLQHEETPTPSEVAAFFDNLLASLAQHHSALLDRVCRRMPTLAAVKYPFSHLREGQAQLISEVYGALRRHSRLFACAPTGIGKTMSVLFPAVRALGEGVFDKVFYFTSKNTGALSAKEAAERLAQCGADLRAVCLSARELLCQKGLLCQSDTGAPCHRSKAAQEREQAAVAQMLESGVPVFDSAAVKETAKAHSLCPYELSLAYAEMCDLVILDYNYLFDSRTLLRRFFAEKGSYAFLVDEAHNLPARVTEAFSQILSPERLLQMAEVFVRDPDMEALFSLAAKGLCDTVDGYVANELTVLPDGTVTGFYATSAAPTALWAVYAELCRRTFEIAKGSQSAPAAYRRRVRRVAYALQDICEKLSRFDDHFTVFYERKGEARFVRVLCLDGAAIMDDCLSRGTAAVLFSATLHPLSYFRDVCGGRRSDPLLELGSPFEKEQMCITVMDRVPVRYSAREQTLRRVVRMILTTVKAKPGNYMVFCPSFAYLDALKEALAQAVPGLSVVAQRPSMTQAQRKAFLSAFDEHNKKAMIGLCVLGGIYGEGVDLVGKRLIGTVIVGVGLPPPSNEREAMRAYYENRYEMGTAYAYAYPGLNRVLQAAGRVIRDEGDRGVIVLIDDRLSEKVYKEMLPSFWHTLAYAGDEHALAARLQRFWQK